MCDSRLKKIKHSVPTKAAFFSMKWSNKQKRYILKPHKGITMKSTILCAITIFAVITATQAQAQARYPIAHNKAEMLTEFPIWNPKPLDSIYGSQVDHLGHLSLLNVVAYTRDVQQSTGVFGKCQFSNTELFERYNDDGLEYAAVTTILDTTTGISREFVLRSFRTYGSSIPGPFGGDLAYYYVGSRDEIGGKYKVQYVYSNYDLYAITAPGFDCRN